MVAVIGAMALVEDVRAQLIPSFISLAVVPAAYWLKAGPGAETWPCPPSSLTIDGTMGEHGAVPDPARPFAVPPGAGATIQGPAGGPLTYKARGEQTGGALTAIENVIAPGDGPPLHAHANEDEAWWVIDGTLRFRLGEETAAAPAGTFVFVPRTVPHAFQNVGATPARILVLFTPAGMERFFDKFATLSAGPEAFAVAGREAEIEQVGPPLSVSDPA